MFSLLWTFHLRIHRFHIRLWSLSTNDLTVFYLCRRNIISLALKKLFFLNHIQTFFFFSRSTSTRYTKSRAKRETLTLPTGAKQNCSQRLSRATPTDEPAKHCITFSLGKFFIRSTTMTCQFGLVLVVVVEFTQKRRRKEIGTGDVDGRLAVIVALLNTIRGDMKHRLLLRSINL